MQQPRRPRPRWRVVAVAGAAALSLGLHALLAGAVWNIPAPPPLHVPRNPITITFQPAPAPSRAAASEAPVPQASPSTPRPDAPPRPAPEPPRPDGQVVRLPPPRQVESPEQARFVSEFDRKADRDTRATRTSATATPAEEFHDEERAAPAHEHLEPPAEAEPKQGTSLKLASLAAPEESYAGGGLMRMWRAAERRRSAGSAGGSQWEERAGDEGTSAADPGAARDGEDRDTLTADGTSERAGGAPSTDALDGVAEGTGTLLNTRQWKHAAFFNRVSDAIKRQWRPNDALRGRRGMPELQRASARHTVVEMTLDRDGRVVRVVLDASSRLDVLDEEALRACRAAGPFPNPPAGLFDGEDHFTFRFGFRVDFTRPRELELFPTARSLGR